MHIYGIHLLNPHKTVVSHLKLFLLSNYVIYHVRIEIVHVVCSVKSVRVVNTMDLGCFLFVFFFSLSKNKYVICCIIFRSRKLIVYTIYGTPRFLVVTCLFSSNETILLRTIINASFYFSHSLNVRWQKKQINKKQLAKSL